MREAKTLPQLTVDELQFAMTSAETAGQFKMPTVSMDEKTRPIEIQGQVYRFTNHPMNHAALAIMEAFKQEPAKGRSAMYRIFMIVPDLLKDERHKAWTRPSPTRAGEMEVQEALMEAIATIPISFGETPSLDAVFALAKRLKGD